MTREFLVAGAILAFAIAWGAYLDVPGDCTAPRGGFVRAPQ